VANTRRLRPEFIPWVPDYAAPVERLVCVCVCVSAIKYR
jgi:hypothetical protein